MRKENEKSLECRIGTTDTNNHILSIVGFWCSQYTGSPFCPRLQNRRNWGHSGEFWGLGEKHEKETDTMKCHCYSRNALYYLAIARCRRLVLNISNKDSHLSKSNLQKKKARKGEPIKGWDKESKWERGGSANQEIHLWRNLRHIALPKLPEPPPPFLPQKRKSLEGTCRLMKTTSCRLLVV